MEDNFGGNVRGFYERKFVDSPKQENKPLPTQYMPQDRKDNFLNGFVIGFVILAVAISLVIGGIFVYYVGQGFFKDTNSQNVNLEPQINVTSNTANQFDNTFTNAFQNNFTLVVNNLNIYTNST